MKEKYKTKFQTVKYTGYWKDVVVNTSPKMDGQGIEECIGVKRPGVLSKNFIYIGNFKDDKRHGYGLLIT